jgi:hypothetical protein
MSRRESDREDLMREATALVERAELAVDGLGESIIVGFRDGGAASFYFSPDTVYQFNAEGELRRAFLGDLLYKAKRGRLISLRRLRSDNEVALVSTELSSEQTAVLTGELQQRLQQLKDALASGRYRVVAQVPRDAGVTGRMRQWLADLPPAIDIARVPNVC